MSAPLPADFSFEYAWRAGSMPPPHHYAFSISGSASGRGRIVFVPGYAFENPPSWQEEFAIDAAAWSTFKHLLQAKKTFARRWREIDSQAVGGSRRSFVFRRDGKETRIPADLSPADAAAAAELEAAVRALVPEALWQSLRQRHAEDKRRRGEE